jgi:hypothetical protein
VGVAVSPLAQDQDINPISGQLDTHPEPRSTSADYQYVRLDKVDIVPVTAVPHAVRLP